MQKGEQMNNTETTKHDINKAMIIRLSRATVTCPHCEYQFIIAPRCPECGQLIQYVYEP